MINDIEQQAPYDSFIYFHSPIALPPTNKARLIFHTRIIINAPRIDESTLLSFLAFMIPQNFYWDSSFEVLKLYSCWDFECHRHCLAHKNVNKSIDSRGNRCPIPSSLHFLLTELACLDIEFPFVINWGECSFHCSELLILILMSMWMLKFFEKNQFYLEFFLEFQISLFLNWLLKCLHLHLWNTILLQLRSDMH